MVVTTNTSSLYLSDALLCTCISSTYSFDFASAQLPLFFQMLSILTGTSRIICFDPLLSRRK